MPTDNNLLGQAGVHRIAAELLLRGFHVLFPAVDDGVDLYTEEGHAVQVKTARLSKVTETWSSYHCQFRSWSCKAGYKKQRSGRIHPKVTHIILWGVDENVFWIIPRAEFKGYALSVRRQSKKFKKFLDAWNLL